MWHCAFGLVVRFETSGNTQPTQRHTPEDLNHRLVEASWNVMAHAQKLDFVIRSKWRVHLNRPGDVSSVDYCAAEVWASAVLMLDTPCSEVVWRVLATHCIRMFPLHFPYLRYCVPSHFNWSLLQFPAYPQDLSRRQWLCNYMLNVK